MNELGPVIHFVIESVIILISLFIGGVFIKRWTETPTTLNGIWAMAYIFPVIGIFIHSGMYMSIDQMRLAFGPDLLDFFTTFPRTFLIVALAWAGVHEIINKITLAKPLCLLKHFIGIFIASFLVWFGFNQINVSASLYIGLGFLSLIPIYVINKFASIQIPRSFYVFLGMDAFAYLYAFAAVESLFDIHYTLFHAFLALGPLLLGIALVRESGKTSMENMDEKAIEYDLSLKQISLFDTLKEQYKQIDTAVTDHVNNARIKD